MRALTKATARVLKPIEVAGWAEEHLVVDMYDDDHFLIQVSDNCGEIYSFLPQFANQLISRFVEKKQAQAINGYVVAATDSNVSILSESWPKDRVSFTDDARLVYDYLVLTSKQCELNADLYAAFKEQNVVPNHDLRLHDEYRCSDYQQMAALLSLKAEGYGLFMEQGTGKTACVITRVCNDIKNKKNGTYRAIIVCPSNVRMNWAKEFDKFATVQGKVTVLRGGQLKRVDQILESLRTTDGDQYSIIVCSYDVLIQSWDAIKMVPFDLGVLDESHYIKWPRTKRCQFAWKLRDICAARMCLTGTPITNTPLDLYAQLEFLGKGFSGFKSWKEFRSFYGVWDKGENGFEKLVSLQNLPFIQERLARYTFIIKKEDALPNLPDKVRDFEECEMTKQQREVYNSVATQMIAEIESMIDRQEKTVVVSNILTKLLRLAQIANGFITFPEIIDEDGNVLQEKSTEVFSPVPKVERLVEMLKDRDPLSKTIIWACWKHDLELIEQRLTEEGHKVVTFHGGTSENDRLEAERAFNCDPECRVFVGNPAAGGTGLNLLGYPPGDESVETNCDWVIYYSQNWSAVQRSQSEDRAHRRGTRQPVRITDLCVPNTLDEEIRSRVSGKIKMAMEVSDIKQILCTVLEGLEI